MIPMKTSTVFKSRWWALIWAAGIIWFALDVAGDPAPADGNSTDASAPTDATGAPIRKEDADALKNVIEGL
jgi:hypothetical protein